jgi:DNA polymerase III sliding clamp (beta) subunit (PCNA family)
MQLDSPWPFGLCVIPRQALAWLANQRKSNNQSTVSIKSDGKYISFTYNDSYFVCELNREQYSYVDEFINSKMDYVATFDVKTLSKTISYAVLGDKNKKVTISAKDYEAEINPYIENSKKWKMKCDIEYGNQLDLTLYASQILPVLQLCDQTVTVYKVPDIDHTYIFKSMYNNFKYLIYC